MRQFVVAMCCAAVVALSPTCCYSQSFGALGGNKREPPVEPSIPVPEKPATAEPAAPKPAVQRPIVRRIHRAPVGPVTMPSAEVLVVMVRGALAAVNQANFTENYSVLHGMTTPALQARVSAGQFGKAFAGLRQQNLDLSPVLVMAPQFTATPALTPQGVLRVAGFFPSRPLQINFAIDYRAVDSYWLIEALSVTALQPNTTARQNEPTTAAASMQRQSMKIPARPTFWERRFAPVTHFGPHLSFANYTR